MDKLNYNNMFSASVYEAYIKLYEKMNELINQSNELVTDVETKIEIMNQILDEGLDGIKPEIINQLYELINNGTFEEIINTNIFNDLNSQIKEKASQTDLEVERARIDNFTKLTEGSTTGDAELIDARIGVDGVTYDNLGSAIRTQIQNLEEDVEYNATGWNLDYNKVPMKFGFSKFIPLKLEVGGITSSNGNNNKNTTAIRSDFITLTSNKVVLFHNTNRSMRFRIYRYNLDKTFSGVEFETSHSSTNETVTISDITNYCYRFLLFNSSDQTGSITLDEALFHYYVAYADDMIIYNTDKTLTKENQIADAKAVGDKINSLTNQNTSFISFIAHQGGKEDGIPQNTIPNFINASKKGYKWIETDVRWTSDGIPVISHDDDRTVYGTLTTVKISETTYSDLITNQFFSDASITIPTYYEMLKTCKLYGLKVAVELKASGTLVQRKDLVDYAKKINMYDKIAMKTFSFGYLSELRTYYPDICLMWTTATIRSIDDIKNSSDYTNLRNMLSDTGEAVISVTCGAEGFDETWINSVRELGFHVGMYSANDLTIIKSLITELDYVTSDYYNLNDIINS